MRWSKLFLLPICASFVLMGAACSNKTNTAAKADGGIYKTSDGGEKWQQKNNLLTAQGLGSFSQANVSKLFFDPTDNKTIYAILEQGGVLVSLDAAESWQQLRGVSGKISSLAIDPKTNCTLYFTQNNKILKSVDCGRSSKVIYFDTRTNQTITAIAVDVFNSDIIWAGLTTGDLLKSTDGGVSWATAYNFKNSIKKFLLNPNDSREFYLSTSNGLYKTSDGATTWTNLSDATNQYSNSRDVTDFFFSPAESNSLISVSRYGLLKSTDGGATWNRIELLTPAGQVTILAAGVSEQNPQQMYYVTTSTFYKTSDGGLNWTTQKLPTSRTITNLLVDSENQNILYFSTKTPAKTK
jgi:photosystem II stability/assembly factor-like uncharacterized protein